MTKRPEGRGRPAGAPRDRPGAPDSESHVVFDFSEVDTPDIGGIGLLLTARIIAAEHDRRVWVRELPGPTARVFEAFGLDHLFHAFSPDDGGSDPN